MPIYAHYDFIHIQIHLLSFTARLIPLFIFVFEDYTDF